MIFLLGLFLVEETQISESQIEARIFFEDGQWQYIFDIDDPDRSRIIFLKCLQLYIYREFPLGTPVFVECNKEIVFSRNHTPINKDYNLHKEWVWRNDNYALKVATSVRHC